MLYLSDKSTLTVGENYWMSKRRERYPHYKGITKQNNFWIGFDGNLHTSFLNAKSRTNLLMVEITSTIPNGDRLTYHRKKHHHRLNVFERQLHQTKASKKYTLNTFLNFYTPKTTNRSSIK